MRDRRQYWESPHLRGWQARLDRGDFRDMAAVGAAAFSAAFEADSRLAWRAVIAWLG